MFDYTHVFGQRGELYNRASKRYPNARATERKIILDKADLRPGVTVVDAPAGGGYVAEGIAQIFGDAVNVICVEPAARFAGGIDPKFQRVVCPLEKINLPDGSADRVVSLAGLHHLPSKIAFFHEASRLLKRGGIFAVADVLEGTAPARFLNGPVDRLSETGHDGDFVKPGELTQLLNEAGLAGVTEQHCTFAWEFPDETALAAYCKDLFGMTKADESQVRREIDRLLEVSTDEAGTARLVWGLVYAVGVKG